MNNRSIYSSVPDHAFRQERENNLANNANVFGYLKQQIEPVTARKIAISCNLPSGGTQVEVRQVITRLIEIDGIPIISVNKGFLIAKSVHQLTYYAARLEERIKGIQRRANSIRRIATNYDFGGV